MTQFIQNNISGDHENILLECRLHWIYVVTGVFWFLIFLFMAFCAKHIYFRFAGGSRFFQAVNIFGLYEGPVYIWLSGFFYMLGIALLLTYILKVIATEIALTDERIIYKTGLFMVNVQEIDLTEIRAEHVDHGLLGRFLGYGRLRLDSRFVGDVFLPAIGKPYTFLRAVHKKRHNLYDPLAEDTLEGNLLKRKGNLS